MGHADVVARLMELLSHLPEQAIEAMNKVIEMLSGMA